MAVRGVKAYVKARYIKGNKNKNVLLNAVVSAI